MRTPRRNSEAIGADALGFAMLAVLSSTVFVLLLRGTMTVWPGGLAGVLARLISVGLLVAWVGGAHPSAPAILP